MATIIGVWCGVYWLPLGQFSSPARPELKLHTGFLSIYSGLLPNLYGPNTAQGVVFRLVHDAGRLHKSVGIVGNDHNRRALS